MTDYPPPSNLFAPPPHHSQNQQQQQHPAPVASPAASVPPVTATGLPAAPHVNVHPPPPPAAKEPFAIKVMRLPSPSFVPLSPLAWKLDSCAGGSTDTALAPLAGQTQFGALMQHGVPGVELALSPQLLLPTNIGTVYLGETFRACVSVWAQPSAAAASAAPAAAGNTTTPAPAAQYTQVGIKLELQTSSRRWTLSDSTAASQLSSLAVGSSRDLIVSHSLSELGVNCLVCLVVFRDDSSGEKRSFQKFFKFQVHDPFSIHTTVHQREGVLLAEVALTSLLNRSVWLWNVHFESANPALIAVQDLNGSSNSGGEANAVVPVGPAAAAGTESGPEGLAGLSAAGAAAAAAAGAADPTRPRSGSVVPSSDAPSAGVLLPGQSSRSFLFRLLELTPASKHVLDLGRLQIRWRSLIGESGRIKSSSVSRTSKILQRDREIDCVVTAAPARVVVEAPFSVQTLLRNGSASPAILVVQLLKDRMGTLLPWGPCVRQLGVVAPGESIPCAFELVGVGLGVQRISGLRVSLTPVLAGTNGAPNTAATIMQDFDHLHQVRRQGCTVRRAETNAQRSAGRATSLDSMMPCTHHCLSASLLSDFVSTPAARSHGHQGGLSDDRAMLRPLALLRPIVQRSCTVTHLIMIRF